MTEAVTAQRVGVDAIFPTVKARVLALTGLEYYADKDHELAGHVARRMNELTIHDCRTYHERLLTDPAEADTLIERLTIGETSFFRHRELFDALRDIVLPAILCRGGTAPRRLRIWSAGCSIGAEAYSLSILLRRELGILSRGWDISIVGTDINLAYLTRAGGATFDEWTLRTTPEDVRRECFERVTAGWQLKDRYREGVSFVRHNLMTDPIPSALHRVFSFDVILCRNVMIYFNESLVRHVVSRCHACLNDDGWLLVGHAETNSERFGQFETVTTPGATLYRKPALGGGHSGFDNREWTLEAPGLGIPKSVYFGALR